MAIPKFRIWWKSEKKMLDYIHQINFNKRFILGEIQNQTVFPLDFDQVEIMQSTGFTDEDDNEVYEDDIIELNYGAYVEYGRVYYDANDACYKVQCADRVVDLRDSHIEFIAGNIYENHELFDKYINKPHKQ